MTTVCNCPKSRGGIFQTDTPRNCPKNGRALIFQTDTPNNRPKPLVIATDARQRSSTAHTAPAKSQSTQNDLLCLYSPVIPFQHKQKRLKSLEISRFSGADDGNRTRVISLED